MKLNENRFNSTRLTYGWFTNWCSFIVAWHNSANQITKFGFYVISYSSFVVVRSLRILWLLPLLLPTPNNSPFSVVSILTDENAMTDVVLLFANNPCALLYEYGSFGYTAVCEYETQWMRIARGKTNRTVTAIPVRNLHFNPKWHKLCFVLRVAQPRHNDFSGKFCPNISWAVCLYIVFTCCGRHVEFGIFPLCDDETILLIKCTFDRYGKKAK